MIEIKQAKLNSVVNNGTDLDISITLQLNRKIPSDKQTRLAIEQKLIQLIDAMRVPLYEV